MKLIKLILIGAVSSLVSLGAGIVFGFPAWFSWAVIMSRVTVSLEKSLIIALITNVIWYNIWVLIWPQPSFFVLYFFLCSPAVLLSSVLTHTFKEKLK